MDCPSRHDSETAEVQVSLYHTEAGSFLEGGAYILVFVSSAIEIVSPWVEEGGVELEYHQRIGFPASEVVMGASHAAWRTGMTMITLRRSLQ
jgi:hypothetical protein